ncbi:hypothetical protein FJY71_00605 [candidate division WOR-3 bacterium]|nr:hypothetical protein [candidate division WOR-3 bacterium]
MNEYLLERRSGGSVAGVAYNPCGVNAASTMLAREFLTRVYRYDERVLGRAVFAAKCSLIVRYPTSDNFYGPAYLWTLLGDPALRIRYAPLTGVEERAKSEVGRVREEQTIVRDVLFLPVSPFTPRSSLFDPSGREVMSLVPGANDVSRLRRGVYFLGDGTKVVLH